MCIGVRDPSRCVPLSAVFRVCVCVYTSLDLKDVRMLSATTGPVKLLKDESHGATTSSSFLPPLFEIFEARIRGNFFEKVCIEKLSLLALQSLLVSRIRFCENFKILSLRLRDSKKKENYPIIISFNWARIITREFCTATSSAIRKRKKDFIPLARTIGIERE